MNMGPQIVTAIAMITGPRPVTKYLRPGGFFKGSG